MHATRPVLTLRIRPSRLQRLAMVSAALLALVAIALADLPSPWGIAAILSTAFITLRAWRQPTVAALRLNSDGSLEWRAAAQDWQAATLMPYSSVTAWLCVLTYRSQGKLYRLAVFPDSLHPEDFRRLRVWLRWQARLASDGPAEAEADR